MLAQNFKTPTDLRINDAEFEALVKVLRMLERGEIDDEHFAMSIFTNECRTTGCICGWAAFISQGAAFPIILETTNSTVIERELQSRLPLGLKRLFGLVVESGSSHDARRALNRDEPLTREESASALRNFLSTGEPNWLEVLDAN